MRRKSIALVAHDNKKPELLNWVIEHRETLEEFDIYATGTTGKLLEKAFKDHGITLSVNSVQSGPLGGDQQIGAKIVEGLVDFLIFFWDPLEPQPHDPDVKALLRIAVTWDIPFACNKNSADFIFGSPAIRGEYSHEPPNFDDYKNRFKNK